MNCRDVSGFLQDYFAGDLPDGVAAEFSVHLGQCENCTVFLEQYRSVIVTERAVLVEDEMCECPEELVQAIVAALRAADAGTIAE